MKQINNAYGDFCTAFANQKFGERENRIEQRKRKMN